MLSFARLGAARGRPPLRGRPDHGFGEKSAATGGGHCGKGVRSDVHVAIEARDSGGLEITMQSRVAPYYGDAILAQARQVFDVLGIKHARVEIRDEGALPFVISARIETSARCRVGPGGERLRRTRSRCPNLRRAIACAARVLYLPGSEPKYFINAALHGPDAIILDLEDSVHHAEKDAAIILVRTPLRAVDFRYSERMVRINQLPMGRKILAGDRSRVARSSAASQGRASRASRGKPIA